MNQFVVATSPPRTGICFCSRYDCGPEADSGQRFPAKAIAPRFSTMSRTSDSAAGRVAGGVPGDQSDRVSVQTPLLVDDPDGDLHAEDTGTENGSDHAAVVTDVADGDLRSRCRCGRGRVRRPDTGRCSRLRATSWSAASRPGEPGPAVRGSPGAPRRSGLFGDGSRTGRPCGRRGRRRTENSLVGTIRTAGLATTDG